MCSFQGFSAPDKNPVLRAFSGTDHYGRWRRQPQSTGAGNNQYGDKVEQGKGESRGWSHKIPGDKRDQCNANHDRYKIAGDDIRHTLYRCLASLRFFNQSNDLRQHSILANLGCLKLKAACFVYGCPDNLIAHLFLHRDTLAGNHGLINAGIALIHNTIYRDSFSGPDRYQVAHLDFFSRYFHFFAIANYQCRPWLQSD
ncbi:hypothetical protein ES703_86147 [subsurface metagenome]